MILSLLESLPGKPLLLHDEPIYCNGDIVGRTTSGNYSFNFKKNLSFGYIKNIPITELTQKNIYIEVEKIKYQAEMLIEPLKVSNYKNI